jgi:2-oxoglutarate dehydrogenase E2 component (dihydrolipoamide succinyltransferase)
MPTDVIMPQMGESIVEGTITKWLKKLGDHVEKDEPLFEISTDKVDAEIPAPVAGILTEIKFPEGDTVGINTVVAVIGQAGSAVAATPVPAATPQVPQSAPQAQLATPQVSQVGGTNVVMPQMGESIVEGTITKWLKKLGDHVEKDEPLFEISTDKVDAEIPAPVDGILTEIKVPEGATVEINTVVAVIGGASASAATAVPATPAPAAAPQVPQSAPQVQLATPQVSQVSRIRSSPLVRRIAKDNNLDLRQVAGTGSDRRITKEDILRHLSQHGSGSAAPVSSAPEVLQSAPQAQLATPQVPQELTPMTRMRAIIAQRMVESKQISPHVHTVYKVDMTRIVRMRAREKAGFEQRNGVKLTYMPFIAAAVIEALRKFPIVNASLEGSSIRYHRNINLGIAVALEWGLIVPVVQQAEERSFLGLARSIADLAERARTKKLMPDETAGSTFTLTNSGIFGDEFSAPIINQPNAAILGISGLKKEAVVLTDAEGNDTIAIRSMQNFCLGFDHRIIDGADGCRFMLEFKKTLESWNREIG